MVQELVTMPKRGEQDTDAAEDEADAVGAAAAGGDVNMSDAGVDAEGEATSGEDDADDEEV